MNSRGYQEAYSSDNPEMHSLEGRERKALTMLRVFANALGERVAQADVLNLGCSTGIIDEFIAPHVGSVVGVDIDEPGVALAISRKSAKNLEFCVDDAMNLALADASFDIVICSQVYEHVPDAVRMAAEIHRVLRPGGFCYFAATNRWAVMEKHYHLPFLSWLPPGLANAYVRALGRSDAYYERHLGYFALRRLMSDFQIEDLTGQILAKPDEFAAGYLFGSALQRAAARTFYGLAKPLFPGYIWLLWKR